MYREQTEPDAGRTGAKTNQPDTRKQSRSRLTLGGRGAIAFVVMIVVAVGGYVLMFAMIDLLIKG
ncbi:MAG: hypothetical protein ACTSXZ_10900 [Alphaproteobacteria bacterium]